MKLTLGLLSVCIGILAVYGQTNPIECEDSKYEWLAKNEKKIYTFIPQLSYESITINACSSVVANTEIKYDLGDGNWVTANSCPGDNSRNAYIQLNNINIGQTVLIRVASSKRQNKGGSSVKLFCFGGISPAPTIATQSPTSVTDTPTSLTISPTLNTQSPTLNTPSPTSNTPSPTDSTQSPTIITPSPTDTTSAPSNVNIPSGGNNNNNNNNCGRHRKPWSFLTKEERLLYINGFKTLHSNGKIAQFNHVHQNNAIHNNYGFLPWHRYFLYELESQIRALGGEYECFALPYFDWAYQLIEANNVFENMIIFKSGLGSIGNGGCVNGGGISNNEYTESNNHFNQGQYNADGTCLIRNSCTGNACYWTGSTIGDLMDKMGDTNEFAVYSSSIERQGHNMCHMQVAGNSNSQIGAPGTAAFDPIFWLLHAYVDYNWAIFQDCHEQETYKDNDVTSSMYAGDATQSMGFGILSNGGNGGISGSTPIENWETKPYVYTSNVGVRPCDLNSWIEGLLADVTYETGPFFEMPAGVYDDVEECSTKMSSNVFVDTGLYRRRRRRLQNGGNYDTDTTYGKFSSNTYNALNERVGGSERDQDQTRSVYKALARLECEYLTMENPCVRPKYFDDCSYMEVALRDRGYQQYQDIEISKEELLEKVGDVQCMIDTIETMYSWSYQTGNLLGLCAGDYYPFCDRESINRERVNNKNEEDECEARETRRRGRNRNDNIYSAHSNVGTDDFMFDNKNNDKLTQIEHILISGMINGLIISSILLMMYCCYKMNQNSSMTTKTHQKYKYDAVDAEYQ